MEWWWHLYYIRYAAVMTTTKYTGNLSCTWKVSPTWTVYIYPYVWQDCTKSIAGAMGLYFAIGVCYIPRNIHVFCHFIFVVVVWHSLILPMPFRIISLALAHMIAMVPVNTLRPKQNGRHFPDDVFKCIFVNENVWNSIQISLKFVPKGPNNNIPALVQIMAWRRPGDKPLSEPMMVILPTHICVTRPQWVK